MNSDVDCTGAAPFLRGYQWTLDEVAGIRWARQCGLSFERIGKSYGLSRSHIRMQLKLYERRELKKIGELANAPEVLALLSFLATEDVS